MENRQGILKALILLTFTIVIAYVLIGGWVQPTLGQLANKQEHLSTVRLGERLFRDNRFSTPNGDLMESCSNCHLFDEDPGGVRAYTDFFIKSWIPFRQRDPRRLMVRNAPTILDAGAMPRLHYDGEFTSLEDLVKGTLFGRPMGWLPGEEAQAFEHARTVVLNDKGEEMSKNYREQFQEAFGVDLSKLSRDETANLIAKAVADYCRTLNTRKDSAYDKFIELNGLDSKPAPGETGRDFAIRFLTQIHSIELKGALKLTTNFDKAALSGLKVFFRVDQGNCATCHTPPYFTDHSFHNIGISQREYDNLHGDGEFAALPIPNAANARRPARQFRETPTRDKPGEADLGFWNFVDLKTSPLRQAGETDERFLQRMIATFKTPTLRNLNYTQPYFHDGSMHTLEEAMSEMMRLSDLARKGLLREADEDLAKIKIAASDIPPLVAFLNSLNEDLKKTPDRGH